MLDLLGEFDLLLRKRCIHDQLPILGGDDDDELESQEGYAKKDMGNKEKCRKEKKVFLFIRNVVDCESVRVGGGGS